MPLGKGQLKRDFVVWLSHMFTWPKNFNCLRSQLMLRKTANVFPRSVRETSQILGWSSGR